MIQGQVDDALRALLEVEVGVSPGNCSERIIVWVDTAFDGHLVFSQSIIEQLGLNQEAATEAILADGSRVTLESYMCSVKWFGKIVSAQVIANEGKFPLLGTELLAGRRLVIDYANKQVEVF